MTRERVGALVVAAGLVLVAVLSSVLPATNSTPGQLPAAFAGSAESTSLFCTGLGSGAAGGHVTFTNLTDSARQLRVQVVSDTRRSVTRSLALGAHASTQVTPTHWVSQGHYFGVSAIVAGGGVVAAAVTSNSQAVAPCTNAGVESWYATGFSTQVGSNAVITLLNPSATPAVVNITTMGAAGFAAPAPYQGLQVGPHAEVAVNLGDQVVNTDNVGVRLKVVNGAVVVAGVQSSKTTVSFNLGQTSASTSALFPLVSTARAATAQVRVANPNDAPVTVTVDITLGDYTIAPESVQVRSFNTAYISITPNSAIPAAGLATLRLHASAPVTAALAQGTTTLALSAPASTARTWLLSDFTGLGFSRVALTNSTKSTAKLEVRAVGASSKVTATLAAGATSELRTLAPAFGDGRGQMVFLTSDRPLALTTLVALGKVAPVVNSALDGG